MTSYLDLLALADDDEHCASVHEELAASLRKQAEKATSRRVSVGLLYRAGVADGCARALRCSAATLRGLHSDPEIIS